MHRLTDTQIRAEVRFVLAKHHVDTGKASVVCTRGTVRMRGELEHHGAYGAVSMRPVELDALEQDLRDLRGIDRLHFDLRNWCRSEAGTWRPVEPVAAGRSRAVRDET